MSDKIKQITNDNFDEVIKNNEKVVIKVFADWCGPCKMYTPTVEKFAEENQDVFVGEVDADIEKELITKFSVKSIPCTIFIKNGEVVQKKNGILPLNDLVTIINNNPQ